MSEIKVNSIKGVGASAAAITINNTDGTCTANITNNLSNRNLIINGSQIIDQRNGGSAITVSPNTSVYTTDRFTIFEATNGVVTAQQSTTAPDGFTKSLKIDCTTIDSTIATLQRLIVTTKIEGNNIAHLGFGSSAAKNVVLSFYVKSNLTGSFSGAISNSANNRVYIYSYTINSANTWERKTIPIVGDTTGTWLTTNGIGLNITWALALGATYGGTAGAWGTVDKNGATNQVNFLSSTDNEWLITGAQFEIDNGSGVASDFEHLSYGDTLAKCQRYYQELSRPRLRGLNSSTTSFLRAGVALPVTMRAGPTAVIVGTLDFYDGTLQTCTSQTASYMTLESVEFDGNYATGTATTGRPATCFVGAGTGKITLSAEL